jgi:branched-chain amino acid aminotransferase
MEFDNLDGFLSGKGDKIFDSSNRVLKYGDGIFETIKLANGNLMFWEDHFNRLNKSAEYLGLETAGKDSVFWKKEVDKIVVKNYYENARIRIVAFRDSPGLYTPMGNRLSFFIEGTRFDKPMYSFTSQGIKLGIFSGDQKAMSPLNNFKTTSALLFVLAGRYKKNRNLDDVIILNAAGRVCETVSSNIFLVKNDKITTPKLTEGCLDGVMRKQIKKIISDKGCKFEESEITLDDLKSADEIFLTNSMSGVQGVAEFEGKRLLNTYTLNFQSSLELLLV